MTDIGTSSSMKREVKDDHPKETFEEVPIVKAVLTYFQYAVLIFWGYISDWLRMAGLKNDCSLKGDVSTVHLMQNRLILVLLLDRVCKARVLCILDLTIAVCVYA